ncbi:unnamed protein product [Coregonus sp. 'balchen']|nr:unnamed protein product [Coregonus sp. 'balchen']
MDDLESELRVPGEELGENESSDDDESINRKRIKKPNLPLAPPIFKETPRETGFHKTTRNCLQHIREVLLHHRWQDAAEYMASYSQTLEDTTANMPQLYAEIIWRIGTEILHHHPESKLEDYNSFYERVKHSGVKHYLKKVTAFMSPTGTLLPRLPSEPGMSLLTIKIDKIGLKDAGQCIDPYMTVSVKDVNGIDLNPVQDTPVATRKEDTYIHFSVDIEIQRHIERLPKGVAIFFEFKHYKPKKGFTSTKCFAFMEMDEIKPGPIVIELYKKPTDFKRKKLQLLTKKPLYLHLHQTLHKD